MYVCLNVFFKPEGEYREGDGIVTRQGQGKYTCGLSGAVYTGNWEADRMNGRGKMELAGAVYEVSPTPPVEIFVAQPLTAAKGDWKDGKMDGTGKYIWDDKSSYIGDWEAGEPHGNAKFIEHTGRLWVGSVEKGVGRGLAPEIT